MPTGKKTVNVDIITDASGDGAKQTARDLDNVEKSANKAGSAIKSEVVDSLKQLPAVATAAVGAALASKVLEATQLADQLADLSGQFGVLATEIQRIGNVAKTEGGSFEAVAAGLNILTKTSQAAMNSGGEMAAAYERLGVTIDDLKGKNPEEIFYLISDGVAQATDRNRAYDDVLTVAGRSAGVLFKTLERGAAQIKAQGDAFGVMSQEDIDRLAEANDQILKLNNQLTVYAGRIAGSAIQWKESVEDVGGLETAVLTLQGAISSLTGQNIDITQYIEPVTEASKNAERAVLGFLFAADESADEAKNSIVDFKNVLASMNTGGGTGALAKGLLDVEITAKAAADAIREVASASSALESAQDRLARAQVENSRAQIDALLAQGKITEEQAANAKANIETDRRAAEIQREQLKIRTEIAATEKDLLNAKAAGNQESEAAAQKELEVLNQLLATIDEINAAEAGKGGAEYQKEMANLREKSERSITDEKRNQRAATEGTLAAEQAITTTQANRPANHRDNPFASDAFNAPVGADQPALQPSTNFQEVLAPRNQPQTPTAPQTPTQPGTSPGTQPAQQDSGATAALQASIEKMTAELAALKEAATKLGDAAPAGIADLSAKLQAGLDKQLAALASFGTVLVGKMESFSSSLTALETRVANIRT